MMTIQAPGVVVQHWRTAARRALAAAHRADDPQPAAALAAAPPEVRELVAHLSDTLTHTAGILLASAVNATPAVREVFREGLAELVREVEAELARGGEPGAVCPLPQQDGTPFECGCGPEGRAACETLAGQAGAGEVALDVWLSPDGHTAYARDTFAPPTVDTDDRARRPHAGDDGCEGGVA